MVTPDNIEDHLTDSAIENPLIICPECDTEYTEEARVDAGMRCSKCAYQYGD